MENNIEENVKEIWKKFKHSLIYENRYFPSDDDLTKKIHSALDLFKYSKCSNLDEMIGNPKMKYYRARLGRWSKEEEIRMPGEEYAKEVSAGRFNPQGIRYFYLANNPQTAIVELRPDVNKYRIITVGVFEQIENRSFSDPMFLYKNQGDPHVKWILGKSTEEQRALLNILGKEISRPVSGNKLEYIPTQYILEYIKKNVDNVYGFKYLSSISDGQNYVYFDDTNFELKCFKYYKFNGIDWEEL